ncbi:uncharacterized protein BDW47DRAFT_98562 [Aspergillus candidus]|uniref:Mtf2-like C-terminal domain-containing protein n=1 Tax=Aspergillus candidus TaxID=41067 RepID=A0A2I2FME1_ASPCN|nr:hypothetical protein BDW47DRAFT_98562 [Aspergillus candidus]PLB41779.1 hypothetical protein BDW47DRAFT_98562 [Aspergillus candidus]
MFLKARPHLTQLKRHSLAPFLYQTDTLAAPRIRVASRALLHTSPASRSSGSEHEVQPEVDDSRVTLESEKTRNSDEARQDESGRFTPRSIHVAPRSSNFHGRKSFLRKRAAKVSQPPPQVAPREPVGLSTMTPKEKQTFQNLLESIGVGQQQESGPETPAARPTLRPAEEMAQITEIFDSVLQDMANKKKGQEETDSQRPGMDPTMDPRAKLRRDREMWQQLKRDDCTNTEISELLSAEKITMDQAVTLVVNREKVRIKSALGEVMDRGEDDIALWEVCEDKIFSLLKHLKDAGVPLRGVKDAGANTEPVSSMDPGPSPGGLTVPPGVPIESVVTTLYPEMLLVAYRLLTLHCPNSPLIGQFRSSIRLHGRASAVLGGSIGLYNELIYFYWRGCQDIPGVITLLQEMEVTGVEPDPKTCKILHSILAESELAMKKHWDEVRENPGQSITPPFWDLEPNRKAVKELRGYHGWKRRLERRVSALERDGGAYKQH